MENENKALEEFGRLLLDLGKIIFAGTVVGDIFTNGSNGLLYGMLGTALCCVVGLVLVVIKKGGKK